MAPGIGFEGETRERRIARADANRLDAEEKKEGPEQVDTERSCDRHPERYSRLDPLRDERRSEMASEHELTPFVEEPDS
jgi:hypothetical protein